MTCEHKNKEELARYSVDCGLSGAWSWIRFKCKDCGLVTVEKHTLDFPTNDTINDGLQMKKTRKKRRKSIT